MGSLVISLCYTDLLPLWLTGIVVFRDVFLLAAGFVIRYISLPPPVRSNLSQKIYFRVVHIFYIVQKTFSRYFDATHVTAQLEPTFISKVNTGVQLATIGISLGAPIWNYLGRYFCKRSLVLFFKNNFIIDHPALHGLWYLTGVTTVAAALSYVINRRDTFKIIQKKTQN